ncbi:unnamed protein product, partial [Mesorhabditis spiculigera]
MYERLDYLIHIGVLVQGVVNENLLDVYNRTHTDEEDDFPLNLLDALNDEDWDDAAGIVLEIPELSLPDSDYILPMLHVLFRLGNVDELLEHADNWRATRNADIDGDKDAHFFVSLLEIQAKAIELNRANSEAWCRLALLYEKFNLHSESKQACETGLKINPECGFIWTVYKLATGEGLNALCRYAKPPIHIPLVISYILAYKKELHKASINALHDVRPRHEFLDVWPIEVDDELDNELSYLEDDGEEPFRLRHQYAKVLPTFVN